MKKPICALLCAMLLCICVVLPRNVRAESGGGALDLLKDLWQYAFETDDSLPYRNGKVEADADVLVVNRNAGTGGKPRYYSAGRFAGTDKYVLDEDYTTSTDVNRTSWKYDGSKGDPIYLMHVYGSALSAKDTFDWENESYLTDDGMGNRSFEGSSGKGTTANGLNYSWFITKPITVPYLDLYYYTNGSIFEADYYQLRAYAFVETGEDRCAVVRVLARADEEKDLPAEEALLERANEFADLIYAEALSGMELETITAAPAAQEGEEAQTVTVGYYLPGDKYVTDETYAGSDGWWYKGVEADPIYFMYVTGVNDRADARVEALKENYVSTDDEGNKLGFNGTVREGTTEKGLKYYWVGIEPEPDINMDIYNKYGLSYSDHYIKYSYVYVETTNDLCAMVAVYAKADTLKEMPEDEALYERCMEFANLISEP